MTSANDPSTSIRAISYTAQSNLAGFTEFEITVKAKPRLGAFARMLLGNIVVSTGKVRLSKELIADKNGKLPS